MNHRTFLSLLSLLFLGSSVGWGIEFTGDLEAFKTQIPSSQLTIKLSDTEAVDLDALCDALKTKQEACPVETLTVTHSPVNFVNSLIGRIQEDTMFPTLTTLDVSHTQSLRKEPITFTGLKDLCQTHPIKKLVLADNQLSETMDFTLKDILHAQVS